MNQKLFQPPQNESVETSSTAKTDKKAQKVENLPDPLVPERVEAVEVKRPGAAGDEAAGKSSKVPARPDERDLNELMAWASNGGGMTVSPSE